MIAAKGTSGEPGEVTLSQVHEAVLLADLVGWTVRHRGEGVDSPELPLRPRLLQHRLHGLAGAGEEILAFRADEYYWLDLGRVESVEQAEKDFQENLII